MGIRTVLVPTSLLLAGLLLSACDSARTEKRKALGRALAARLGELDRRFRDRGAEPPLLDELRRLRSKLPAGNDGLRKRFETLQAKVDAAFRASEELPYQDRFAKLEQRMRAEGASEALLAELEAFTASISDDMFRLRARSERFAEQVREELRESGVRELEERGRSLNERLAANGPSEGLLAAARAFLADLAASPLDVAALRSEHASLLPQIQKALKQQASSSYRAWLADLEARKKLGASEMLLREAKKLQERIPSEFTGLRREALALAEGIESAYEKVKARAQLGEQLARLESELAGKGASKELRLAAREYQTRLEQSPWKPGELLTRTQALLNGIRQGLVAMKGVPGVEQRSSSEPKDGTLAKLVRLRQELGKLEAEIPRGLPGIQRKYLALLASLDTEIHRREGGLPAEAAARAELSRIPKGWALPAGVVRKGDSYVLEGPDPCEMLLISPGRFASGGGKELAPFLMDRFEVTVERFRPFVEAMRKNPSRFIDGLLYWDEVGYDYPTQAVVGVSLHDVRNFARWAGKQVPSEAEWEYAASWDAENNIWRRYPWGDRFDPGIHSKAFPPVVTELALDASPWGVSGMGTGVKEWCELPDFRIESGVIRGASQVLGSRTDRIRTPIADARFESSWKTRANNLGFRCILKLKKANEK